MRSVLKALSLSLTSLFLAATLAACDGGGDDPGPAPTPTPTPADSRPISALSPTELDAACDKLASGITAAQKEGIGRFTCALGFAFAPEQCTDAALAECVDEFVAEFDGPGAGECDIGADTAACHATVEEIRKCTADSLDAMASASAGFTTCESLSEEPAGGPVDLDPPSCDVVKQKCPSFGEDDEEGSDDEPSAP